MSANGKSCAVDDCEMPARRRGWCAKHYTRWVRNGDPMATIRGSLEERLADRLVSLDRGFATPCLVYTGELSGGYGRIKVGRKKFLVHRVVWELRVGPIPEGLQLDHLCRVRSCANTDHLEPVSAYVNTLRGEGFAAVNKRKTHCPRGHEYSGANLRVTPQGTRACRTCRRDAAREAARASRRRVA